MTVIRNKPVMDALQHVIALDERLAIGEAQDLEAMCFQLGSASCIGLECFGLEMLTAVEFDNEARFDTSEVGEIPTNGMLAAELVAGEPAIAQPSPQCTLRFGRRSAQFTRPHPGPLPQAGEGIARRVA